MVNKYQLVQSFWLVSKFELTVLTNPCSDFFHQSVIKSFAAAEDILLEK